MEIHLHLAAAYPGEPWVEHFEWLEPVFNERLEIRDGCMHVPDRPGLGFTLSEAAASWTREAVEFGRRPYIFILQPVASQMTEYSLSDATPDNLMKVTYATPEP